MTVSIRMSDEEKKLGESYAKLHGETLSSAMRKAYFEKIEDEFDAAVGDEAYEEYVKDGCKSRPASDLWKELGLE